MVIHEGYKNDKKESLQKTQILKRQLTLDDVPLNVSLVNKHSFKTIPSHHPPKENLSDDSLHLPDEVSRFKISAKASPLEEPEETAR